MPFEGTARLDGYALAHGAANRDKLMDGFYIEENAKVWVKPHARVLLTRTDTQQFVKVDGFIPNIAKYPAKQFSLRLATTERYVGDHDLGSYEVGQSGKFDFVLPLSDEARRKKNLLIDLFGSRMDTNGHDERELSWILESISLQ